MKKSELEHITKSLRKELKSHLSYVQLKSHSTLFSKFINLISIATKELPEHKVFFNSEWAERYSINVSDAVEFCDYILELLELKTRSEKRIGKRNIFQEAEDKLKEAGVSFSKSDPTSVINNLNTCIELVLKDKLDIPMTITKINTDKIIDICIAHKVGPVEYLKEIQKHVIEIDNGGKHQGYSPSRKDCINAIKATEDFLKKAKKSSFKVKEEIKEEIYSGL
ncbi:MAG: hypothetical protein ACE5OT_05335 [Candidatus Hadarchaeaceae archaeon]